MSRENVETFKRMVEASNRGDSAAAIAACDRDIVFVPLRAALEGGYRGYTPVGVTLDERVGRLSSMRLSLRPCIVVAALALLGSPAAEAKQLDLGVANGASIKLKHPQHVLLQVPESATETPVTGDPSAKLAKGVDLTQGSCHLGFTAKATYEHTIAGGTLKRRALDFSGEFTGAPNIFGQGKLHNSKAKAGGKKVLGGYWASALSTGEDVGLTTYVAHAVYRFSAGYFKKKRNGGHRFAKPPNAETVIAFEHGVPLQVSGEQCSQPDREAAQADFSKAIASAQLTG